MALKPNVVENEKKIEMKWSIDALAHALEVWNVELINCGTQHNTYVYSYTLKLTVMASPTSFQGDNVMRLPLTSRLGSYELSDVGEFS